MDFYANLHMHSTHSDGVYSPRELVRIARDEGYSAIAITDHDTASAYPELKQCCEELGMECLFGVEFSVQKPKNYHIVGFGFDPEYPPMKQYLADMAVRQTDNTKKCFEEAVASGGITGITWQEVLEFNRGIPWLCNNHVFELLKARGLETQDNYAAWFDRLFSKQREKYPPIREFLPLGELVKLIKAAGGFAVVAHPHKQLEDLDFLMEQGIEGLEVWHSDLTEEEKAQALALALEKGLFVSGGSDHSGLLGGYYDSYPNEAALKQSEYYIEPHSVGTTKAFYEEIKVHKLCRNASET